MVAFNEAFAVSGSGVANIGASHTWAASIDSFNTDGSGRVYSSSSAVRLAWITTPCESTEHYAQAELHAEDTGVVVRCDGGVSDGYYTRMSSGGTVQLYRWFATYIGGVSLGTAPTFPGTLKVEVYDDGADVKFDVSWNGAPVGTITDVGGLQTGDYVGIHTKTASSPAVDNFEGGDSSLPPNEPGDTDPIPALNGIDLRYSALQWSSGHDQKINLWPNGAHAIGTQDATTYVRTSGRFSVHQSGDHSGDENDPGNSGTTILSLHAGPESIEHVGKRVWTAGNTTGATKAAAITPVTGQQFYETNTGRLLIWNGLSWDYVGGCVQYDETVTKTSSSSQTGSLGVSSSYTPDVRHQAHISFDHVIDIDAAGRAGVVSLKRSIGGGSLANLLTTRFHDAAEGQNYQLAFSYFDNGEDWVVGQSVVYEVTFSNDQSSSVTHRAEGHFEIQWIGRV